MITKLVADDLASPSEIEVREIPLPLPLPSGTDEYRRGYQDGRALYPGIRSELEALKQAVMWANAEIGYNEYASIGALCRDAIASSSYSDTDKGHAQTLLKYLTEGE